MKKYLILMYGLVASIGLSAQEIRFGRAISGMTEFSKGI